MTAEQSFHHTGLTPRVVRRVQQDFPGEFQLVDDVLSRLQVSTLDPERVVAAVVIAARGELSGVVRGVEEANHHPDELLMGAGLAHQDWADRLDAELGAVAAPPDQERGG